MAALRSALRDQAAPTVRDAAVLVAVAAAAGAVAAWRMSRGLPRSRLVDDMLRLARLGQRPGQSAEPVDMTAVVAGCAERARIADPARTWQVRIADGLATVGDEELLRRAVDNLLMNVLVHTPADAAGAISAYETGGQVIIDVSDDGPGVPPDQLPHIFERFYRGGARSRLYLPGQPARPPGRRVSAWPSPPRSPPRTAASRTPRQGSPKGLRITLSLPVDGRSADHPDPYAGERELAATVG